MITEDRITKGPQPLGDVTAKVQALADKRSRGILPWTSLPHSEEREIARRYFPEITDEAIRKDPEAIAHAVWQIQQCLKCQLGRRQADGRIGRCNLGEEPDVFDPNGYGGTKMHRLKHKKLPYMEGEAIRYEWTMVRCAGPEQTALELAEMKDIGGGMRGVEVDDDYDAGTRRRG